MESARQTNQTSCRGRVNANFCVSYPQKSKCTQNHGSEPKSFTINGTQSQHIPNKHDTNDHGAIMRVCEKRACASFAKNIYISLNCLMGKAVVKALLKCTIRFSISFHWYTLPSFVYGLRKPRTSFSCCLYEQFAASISSGLCNPQLIFPRINGPIVFNCKRLQLYCSSTIGYIYKVARVENVHSEKVVCFLY